jgi:hypothetical protein
VPRLSADVTTRTEVDLSPKLTKQLRAALIAFRDKTKAKKVLEGELVTDKTALEMLFADADEYAALEEGVRVNTPFGEVPMKIVKGQTAPKLNMKKLLKHPKFTLSSKELESCYDAPKEKAAYLGVWLPKEDDDESDDE